MGGDWYKAVNHSFLGLVARLFGCTLAHESYWRGDDSGKALVEHFLPLRESISMQCSEAARKERPDLWSVIELAKDKKRFWSTMWTNLAGLKSVPSLLSLFGESAP